MMMLPDDPMSRADVRPVPRIEVFTGSGRSGINPLAYLTDLLTKIVNGHLNSQIDDLMPWNYPPAGSCKDVA